MKKVREPINSIRCTILNGESPLNRELFSCNSSDETDSTNQNKKIRQLTDFKYDDLKLLSKYQIN